MTTRRSRFERGSTGSTKKHQIAKERFLENAIEARSLLDTVIKEAAADNTNEALDSLVAFDQHLDKVYTLGRWIDEDER